MYISIKYIDLKKSEHALEGVFKFDSIRYLTSVGRAEITSGQIKLLLPCEYSEYETKVLARIRQAILNDALLVVCDGTCFLCSYGDSCKPDTCDMCTAITSYIENNKDDFNGKYNIIW